MSVFGALDELRNRPVGGQELARRARKGFRQRIPLLRDNALFGEGVVEAREALAIGLVNALERDRPVLDAALEMAAMIAANPPEGVEAVKSLVDAGLGGPLQAGYQAEHDWMIQHMRHAGHSGSDVFGGFLAAHRG